MDKRLICCFPNQIIINHFSKEKFVRHVFVNFHKPLLKALFKSATKSTKAPWLQPAINQVTKAQSAPLCRSDNSAFKESTNEPVSCKMELCYLRLASGALRFETKRWRDRLRKERGRLNGPLEQNDCCEEGSQTNRAVIIVGVFTVDYWLLLSAAPWYNSTDEKGLLWTNGNRFI